MSTVWRSAGQEVVRGIALAAIASGAGCDCTGACIRPMMAIAAMYENHRDMAASEN
jgi:hypothetical protein